MSQAPSKDKRKEEKDNIFLDVVYNLVAYVPVLIVSWVIDKFLD